MHMMLGMYAVEKKLVWAPRLQLMHMMLAVMRG